MIVEIVHGVGSDHNKLTNFMVFDVHPGGGLFIGNLNDVCGSL